MSRTVIESTFTTMQNTAKELGVTLFTKKETFFDDEHLDCIWYGGETGGFFYKGFKVIFEVNGDVELEGVVKDKPFLYRNRQNTGAMSFTASDILRTTFKNDAKLYSALSDEAEDDDTSLEFKNNNWIEACILNSKDECIESVAIDWTDNVLEACANIKDMVDWLDKEFVRS